MGPAPRSCRMELQMATGRGVNRPLTGLGGKRVLINSEGTREGGGRASRSSGRLRPGHVVWGSTESCRQAACDGDIRSGARVQTHSKRLRASGPRATWQGPGRLPLQGSGTF